MRQQRKLLKQYNSMLEAIAYLGGFFAGLLFVRAAVDQFTFTYGYWLWITTIVVAAVPLSGLLYRQALAGNFHCDLWLPWYQRQKTDPVIKGRVVTTLFSSYLLAVTLATMRDGGVEKSGYGSLIILSGSLGYYFASKNGWTKFSIIAFSFLAYVLSSVVYVSNVKGSPWSVWVDHHWDHLPFVYYVVAVIVLSATYTLKKDG